MGGRWSSTRGKVLAGIGAGVLGRWITPSLADEVTTGEPREQRFRALPARLGVYFVLGLCLEAGKPYRAVLKDLPAGGRQGGPLPADPAGHADRLRDPGCAGRGHGPAVRQGDGRAVPGPRAAGQPAPRDAAAG